MSLEGSINRFDSEVKAWILIFLFPSDQGFMPVFRGHAGDSRNSEFAKGEQPKLLVRGEGKVGLQTLIFLLSMHQYQQTRYSSSS